MDSRFKDDYSGVFRNTGAAQRMIQDGNYNTQPFHEVKNNTKTALLIVLVLSILLAVYSLLNS